MKTLLVTFLICSFSYIAYGTYNDVSTVSFLQNVPASDIVFHDLNYTRIIPIDSDMFKDHQRRAQGLRANLLGETKSIQSRRVNKNIRIRNNCKLHSDGTYLCEEETSRRPPHRRSLHPKNKYRGKYFCRSASEKPSVTKQMDRLLGRTRPPCHENEGTKAYSQSTTENQSYYITSNVSKVTEAIVEDSPITDYTSSTSPDSSDVTAIYSTPAAGRLSSTEISNTSIDSHSFDNENTTTTAATEELPLNASLSTGTSSTAAGIPTIEETTIPVTAAVTTLTTTAATQERETATTAASTEEIITEQTLIISKSINISYVNNPSLRLGRFDITNHLKNKENTGTKHSKANKNSGTTTAHLDKLPKYSPLATNTNNSNLEGQIVAVRTNAVLGNQSLSGEQNIEITNKLKISDNKGKLTTEINKPIGKKFKFEES